MAPLIHIVGLGPGPARYLTLETRDLLLSGLPVYLRTAVHPTIAELHAWGCTYTSFDPLYEKADHFALLYQQIGELLVQEANAHGEIVYALPGHPLVAETTVQNLQRLAPEHGIRLHIVPSMSCLDVIFTALGIDPGDGLQVRDGLVLDGRNLSYEHPLLITQIYSQPVASEIKLQLLERLDPEQPVTLIRAAGCEDQQIAEIALEELDRQPWIDHLTTLYIPAVPAAKAPWVRLREVVAQLRNPEGGCPWDLKQTHHSLRKYVLEEAYEVISAIESEDPDALCEELGDLLLQVVLQAQVAEDEDSFTLDEVANGIADKLIFRHPHVFGDAEAETPEAVREQWEILKAQEKAAKGGEASHSVLGDLPLAMPSLALAEKISRKVAHVGFDWPEVRGVLAKIDEEYQELKEACAENEPKAIFHELGDALFTLVNLARWYKLDPEDALRQTNQRFTRRFQAMETLLAGRSLKAIDAQTWDQLWNQAKEQVG